MQNSIVLVRALFFILMLTVCSGLNSQSSEAEYRDIIQGYLGGQVEVSVTSGRADIVNNEYAIEVEFSDKWKNAIGQSLWYGLQLNKKSGIVLIIRDESEYKYLQQLNSALAYAKLNESIKVWAYPFDFEVKETQIDQPQKALSQIQFFTSKYSTKAFDISEKYGKIKCSASLVNTKYILETTDVELALSELKRKGFSDAFVLKDNVLCVECSQLQKKTNTKSSISSEISYPTKRTKSTTTYKPKYKSSRTYYRGPRGGCYYINSNGNKSYVSRSYCN